jgi:hypothetical protein
VHGRGLLMGNRGILHDAQRALIRDSQVRRCIACRLEQALGLASATTRS